MDTAEIRRSFIDFFAERDHEVVLSSSLIPVDPTLLLTNAGMVQFKPYMVGDEAAPWRRATSVQRCARAGGKHNDLEAVGHSSRHLTFFEMLGNFSFGDYFKERAIPYAWELVTRVWGFDPDLLWVTVHETDAEAAEIWRDAVGVAPERIQSMGADNWWTMGVAGPCGPCSEIFYDKGPAFGLQGGPAADDERYVEIWNLVFMQYLMDESGAIQGELPQKNIDTGAGLERVAAALGQKASIYDIDTIRPVIAVAEDAAGVSYGSDARRDVSLRILGDHGRSCTALVSDGVFPSNEERGYVLRRIIRRAVRHAWLLGINEPIMPRLADSVADVLGDAYPEIVRSLDVTRDILGNEEERFRSTLRSGLALLDTEFEAVSDDKLPGSVAFKLHDTYGFPIEVTREIAHERHMVIDEAAFDAEMMEQRRRARSATREVVTDEEATETYRRIVDRIGTTRFCGYGVTQTDGEIAALVCAGREIDHAGVGAQIEVFAPATPFYAEGGGQLGDTGFIRTGMAMVEVLDTQRVAPGLVAHRGVVTRGTVHPGDLVTFEVDAQRRAGLRRHHSATHLLHWALRDVLGDHVRQHGSVVEPDRLRFDFSHFAAVTPPELARVEELVNRDVLTNAPVSTYETSKSEADAKGVMAFFGDRYGERVRVVETGLHSKELCGGTHVASLGEIGPIVITSESSIGSNLRRIEALAGVAALEYLNRQRYLLGEVASRLRVPPEDVPMHLDRRLDELTAMRKEQERLSAKLAAGEIDDLIDSAFRIGGSARAVVTRITSAGNPKELQRLATELRGRLGAGVAVLGADFGGKASLVAAVSKDLQAKGLSAADVVRSAAATVGGGTGTNPELAMAGGPRGGAIDAALDVARDCLTSWQPEPDA